MKYRTGFVTNSSSSSFIINKKNPFTSIEDVFEFLKKLFIDYVEMQQKMVNFCKEDSRFVVTEEDGETEIKLANPKLPYEAYRALSVEMQNKFGMTWHDATPRNADWMHCKTYEEFLKFAEERYFYIEIVDLENPQFNSQSDIEDVDYLVDWYMPCFRDEPNKQCTTCKERQYCAVYKHGGNLAKDIKACKSKDEVISNFFGRYCICSECGYIPDYVVGELAKASTFFCNHMG